MTDFRALCAELLQELEHTSAWDYRQALKDQARAALAQPEPQGPADEVDHILKLAAIIREVDGGNKLGAASLAEAILSHRDNCWTRPTIEPVPVAERLPGPEDCDEEGRCWLYEHFIEEWRLGYGSWVARFPIAYSHWLPHHALPVPQQEADRG